MDQYVQIPFDNGFGELLVERGGKFGHLFNYSISRSLAADLSICGKRRSIIGRFRV
jgi:hypothetical protein